MQTGAMPRSAVVVICALLVGMSVAMAVQAVALAADGAFELVVILGSGDFYGTSARRFAAYVHQGPVLVASHLGVTDTHTLAVLFGFGQVVIPSAAWSVAIVLTRRDRLVCAAVALVAALCCSATWLAAVSPIVLVVPLTVVVAAVLWLPQTWRKRDVGVAIACCVVLVATYETAMVTGAVLAGWALWRRRHARPRLERHGCLTVAALSALSVTVAAVGTRSGRNPTHSQSLLYFLVSLEPWPFYVALGGVAAVIMALGPWLPTTARWIGLAVGIGALAGAAVGFRPDPVTAFEVRGGVAAAGLALVLFLLWQWRFGRPLATPDRHGPALLVAVPVVVAAAMVLGNVRPLVEWSRSIDAFRESVDATSGVTEVTQVLPPGKRQVLFDWTSSSLSLVLRSDAGSGILVDPSPAYVPFPPAEARRQLPDKYVWRR
jgi:hypothetical protein